MSAQVRRDAWCWVGCTCACTCATDTCWLLLLALLALLAVFGPGLGDLLGGGSPSSESSTSSMVVDDGLGRLTMVYVATAATGDAGDSTAVAAAATPACRMPNMTMQRTCKGVDNTTSPDPTYIVRAPNSSLPPIMM